MDRAELSKNLCAKFCSYYKPWRDEELACMGFLVIERLIKAGQEIPFEKGGEKAGSLTEDALIQGMCKACPFYESDCDFIEKSRNALPCGGFILLGQLTESGVISIDGIRDIL